MKKLVILGSTGSLGKQTVALLEKYKNHFKVIGLSANKNADLLNAQAKSFHFDPQNTVLASRDGHEEIDRLASEADIVVNVLSGIAGISPSLSALEAGKILLLGNKESMVAEGERISKFSELIPLDSEHNAIYEIIKKFPEKKIRKIALPCSGGPFLGKTESELEKVTVEDAISHPKWSMGDKISVESATLINKGLEIIEAYYLFNLPLEKIDVFIHPECQIHGMVYFEGEDRPYAYFSPPNMTEHIENALLRTIGEIPKREIRILEENEYQFQSPDHKTFKGISLTLDFFRRKPNEMRSFLEKEEELVQKFLKREIGFLDIFRYMA